MAEELGFTRPQDRPSSSVADVAVNRLATAIQRGQELGKLALYFGCWDRPGHYLHQPGGQVVWAARKLPDLPWSEGLMDGGLLKNGKHADHYDGQVFWTCGGKSLWYAFYWWDRSGDGRGASNSGLYVRGFGWPEAQAAFDYACEQYPTVLKRQKHPLILQRPTPAGSHHLSEPHEGPQARVNTTITTPNTEATP